jgi:putative oxidoreductase
MNNRSIDWAALLLRVGVGLIFIPHGFSKVFGSGGVAAFAQDIPAFGLPAFLGYVAAYSEMFGAILLIAGLFTRLDAVLLACTMTVAVLFVCLPDVLHDPQRNTGLFFAVMHAAELPICLFGASTALAILGPGRFSLDALLRIEQRVAARLRRRGNTGVSAIPAR